MKWGTTKRIRIAAIKLPGNFATRRAAPEVAERAESIKRLGVINLPVIDGDTGRLLAGHDRIAALMELGEKTVEVRTWQGTEQEFREVQIAENLHRRHDDKAALTAELVRIREGELPDAASNNSPRRPGRPKLPRTLARESVAREQGTTVEAVRKAESRDAAKKAPPPIGPEKEPPPVETWGNPMHDADAAVVRRQHAAIDAVDSALRRALALSRDLASFSGMSLWVDYLGKRIQALSEGVRAKRYKYLCPACKGECLECTWCGQVGLLRADQPVDPAFFASSEAKSTHRPAEERSDADETSKLSSQEIDTDAEVPF